MKNLFIIFEKIKIRTLAFTEYISAYGKSVKDGYKTNAYSPLVWFVIFLIIPLVGIVLFIKNDVIQYIVLILIILIIIYTLIMYAVLFKRDPKLLQSEWYRLENKKLDMIATKGDNGEIIKQVFSANAEITNEEIKRELHE